MLSILLGIAQSFHNLDHWADLQKSRPYRQTSLRQQILRVEIRSLYNQHSQDNRAQYEFLLSYDPQKASTLVSQIRSVSRVFVRGLWQEFKSISPGRTYDLIWSTFSVRKSSREDPHRSHWLDSIQSPNHSKHDWKLWIGWMLFDQREL